MNTDDTRRGNIMRRVYALYFFRLATSPRVRYAVLFGAALGMFSLVSIKNVAFNAYVAASSLGGFLQYVISAFTTTDSIVRILFLVTLCMLVLSLRDALSVLSRGISLSLKDA